MAQLTFTGRSGDGKRLLLVDPSGQEHTLVIDARLRRALSGAPESNGQLEIPMESTLRPRDIQARIRAGETPESVAHAAGTSVEKIMPFAAPVMAERAHMVQRAQLASVRRRASESGARTLGDAVDAHLRAHNVDPSVVEWDAWRREDGRWTLTGLYDVAGRTGAATFSHDPRGNFVTVDDEDARWLIGDAAPAASPLPRSPPPTTWPRPAAAGWAPGAAPTRSSPWARTPSRWSPTRSPRPRPRWRSRRRRTTRRWVPSSRSRPTSTTPPPRRADTARRGRPRSDAEDVADESGAASEPKAKPAKKRGRASVPSWDEIMFGGGKND